MAEDLRERERERDVGRGTARGGKRERENLRREQIVGQGLTEAEVVENGKSKQYLIMHIVILYYSGTTGTIETD